MKRGKQLVSTNTVVNVKLAQRFVYPLARLRESVGEREMCMMGSIIRGVTPAMHVRCQPLTGQPHVDILHVIICINRVQKRFNLFALGVVQRYRIFWPVA